MPALGLIGAGRMGLALLEGLLEAGVFPPEQVAVADVNPERVAAARALGVEAGGDPRPLARQANLLLLAVKPGDLLPLFEAVRAELPAGARLISIAAGVTTAAIEGMAGKPVSVVRAMPNLPVVVRAGAIAIAAGRQAGEAELAAARRIFEAVGHVVVVPEPLLDAVTGLSGSGPAYVCVMLEALADGGVAAGLPRPVASRLAAQTLLGTAQMVLGQGVPPAVLREMVMSPAGTTAEGLRVLEGRAVRSAFLEAVVGAARRARELAGGG